MKKKKLILLVGLALLMQTRPTHAAASIANLQASLEALKSKLTTLAQALGKINQKYIPFDELSAEQKKQLHFLTQYYNNPSINQKKRLNNQISLAKLMNAYATEPEHESLKTFIGMTYDKDIYFTTWISNLYNGMLVDDKPITDQAKKDALPSNQLFPTNDALKEVIQSFVPVGPMTPKRDNVWNPNPNPNPSTAKTYADLDADQKAAYDELNEALQAYTTAAGQMVKPVKLGALQNALKKFAKPETNGIEGLKTFIASNKANLKDIKDSKFQTALSAIENQLAAGAQPGDSSGSSDGSGSSTSTLSEEQQAAYDALAKQRRAVGDNPQDITAKVALKALTSLMETDIADNNVALKKFIIDEYNKPNSVALFDNIYQSSSNKDLKQIIKDAKVAALGTAPQEKDLTLNKNEQKLVGDITTKFNAIKLDRTDQMNVLPITAFKQEVKKLSKNTKVEQLIFKTFLESIQTKAALERIKSWLDDSVKQGIVDEVVAARFP